jgi:hypothetical protein
MNDSTVILNDSAENLKEFQKISSNNSKTIDQSNINKESSKNFNIHEIFTNLNYPSCPEKLDKINLDKLLNKKINMEIKETNNYKIEDNLDCNFNIITSQSFNTYSVCTCLNKIKYLKTLKEEISELETKNLVNTPSSNNVQHSDVLITEDLDTLIKGVKSIPVIPKLQRMVPIINKPLLKNDDNYMNKRKKRNRRKRKNERDRYSKEYIDEDGDRSPKSRKINNINKNWDDITIEESQYFDIEDKENSFESILNQYNSMKQLPNDILVISQILNDPLDGSNNKANNDNSEIATANEKKIIPKSDKSNISLNSLSSENKKQNAQPLNEDVETTSPNKEIIQVSKIETKLLNKNSENNSLNLKGHIKSNNKINEEFSDIWNKNSPVSSTSSNASLSNMSDEETNYNTTLDNHKKNKLDSLKYKSILTPPTPPQPLD